MLIDRTLGLNMWGLSQETQGKNWKSKRKILIKDLEAKFKLLCPLWLLVYTDVYFKQLLFFIIDNIYNKMNNK